MQSLAETVQTWLGGVIDFVYPPLCLGCGEFYEGEDGVCEQCRDRIQKLPHPTCLNCLSVLPDRPRCPVCGDLSLPMFAYGDYTSPLKDIILQYKFKGVTSPATLLARLLWDEFGDRLSQLTPTVLVPVPLHPGRESRRGYNQAALLARSLAVHMENSVEENILFRVARRKPQASLRLRQRVKNIRGVFKAAPAADDPPRIILLDDVVTSGATVLEATRVLNRAGYEVVAVVTIAHGT